MRFGGLEWFTAELIGRRTAHDGGDSQASARRVCKDYCSICFHMACVLCSALHWHVILTAGYQRRLDESLA